MSIRICAALALACGLAHAADEQPLVDLEAPDLQRSIERFWNTPLGRLWQDTAFDDLRQQVTDEWEQARQDAQEEVGFDPQALIDGLGAGRLRLDAIDPVAHTASFYGQLAVGPVADGIMSKAAEELEEAEVASADEALRIAEPGSPVFLLARFGERLVFADEASMAPPGEIAADEHDLHGRLDLNGLMAMAQQTMQMLGQPAAEMPAQPDLELRLKIIPEGFLEQWQADGLLVGAQAPVNLDLLGHLPTSTVAAMALGFDGKRAWELQGEQILQQLAMAQGTDAAGLQAEIERQLQGMGLQADLPTLIGNITGTIGLAVGQGAPFPTVTLILPASPEIDQMLEMALMLGFQKPLPAVGESAMFPLPNAPMVNVNIGRAAEAWMIGTDPAAIGNLVGGRSGGWADSTAARLALSRAGEAPEMIGTSDTRTLLTMATGYLSMAGGFVQGEQAQQLMLATRALQRLSTMVDTGYLVAGPVEGAWRMEARGVLTPMSIYGAIIPAAALVGLRQQAMGQQTLMTIEEGAGQAEATMILAAELLTAQMAFRGGAYLDQDQDNTGEFAFPAELAGGDVGGRSMQILGQRWSGKQPLTLDGLQVKVWLPGGPSQAISDPSLRTADGTDLREQHFVAYAWPADDNGNTMYAIDERGQLYETDYWGVEPAWNELYEGGDWGSQPAWDEVE